MGKSRRSKAIGKYYKVECLETENDAKTTIELSKDNHDAAHKIEKQFRIEKTGSVTGAVDWAKVDAREIKELGERMIDAAGVPKAIQYQYLNQVSGWLYQRVSVKKCPK